MTPDFSIFQSEEDAKAALSYELYRAWRAWALGRPYKRTWKARAVKPDPGVFDLVDDTEG